MIVLWFIMIMAFVVFPISIKYTEVQSRKTKTNQISGPKKVWLSQPAQEILDLYHTLPVDSQVMDIEPALQALDIEAGGREFLHNHYEKKFPHPDYSSLRQIRHKEHSRWEYVYPEWRAECPDKIYVPLMNQIKALVKAKAAQEKALILAGNEGGRNEIALLTERLRNEVEITNQVTKELT